MRALVTIVSIALILAFVGGCGCRKSREEKAEDILLKHSSSKEEISELAKKGVSHLAKLLESKSSRTRMAAITALGEIKDNPEATRLLVKATESENDSDVYFALIALANQGAAEAKALIERFFTHENPYFREAACHAIGVYGDKDLYPLLDKAMRDPVPTVGSAASLVKKKHGIK